MVEETMELILTILVGAVGGAIGKRGRIPGGVMVGAMIAVTVFNVITGNAYVTHDERAFAQMIAGAFSGCMITRGDLRRMPKLAGPALWILGLFLLMALTIGGVLLRITSMSRITCYMALVPGSAVNTPIIAADYGSDVAAVAILQMTRLFIGVGIFPSMILWYGRKMASRRAESGEGTDGPMFQNKRLGQTAENVSMTLAATLLCGLFGDRIGFPGGALVFSMFGVMLFNVICGRAVLPVWLKRLAQVVCGCYIGAHITRTDLTNLTELAFPALIIVAAYSINCFAAGHLLNRLYGYRLEKAMLMATPAGAADMLLIATDLGVADMDIIIIHMIRSVAAVAVYPPLLYAIARMIG